MPRANANMVRRGTPRGSVIGVVAPPGSRAPHVYGLEASATKANAPGRHIALGP